ncbi:hypothetical protein COCON_G00017770 [Conger conger]|uniref:Ig-like domain-containing protein n=1 Tax=Conger conger TaxID=82655 RepID=A0A9Q1E3X0_CONCO|nr:hypothetical protein COCON_G00017770 [Conger conger]
MTRAPIVFITVWVWLTGIMQVFTAQPGRVQQFPPSLLLRSGEPATLNCSHSVPSYNTILWYRQPGAGGVLELLGYLYHNNQNLEPLMEKTLKLEGDGKKSGTMTISGNGLAVGDAVYFCAARFALGNSVHQSPSALLGAPGKSVQLSCSHGIQSYDTILWYQQPRRGNGMTLIGRVSYENVVTEGEERFRVSGDGESQAFLHIDKLAPTDSAAYLCAAWMSQCCRFCGLHHSCPVSPHADTTSWGNCLADSVTFEQTPVRTARPGEQAEIDCSHDDGALLVMLWYERRAGSGALRLIGFGYSSVEPTYEAPFSAPRFQLGRESVQKGSLVVSAVTEADSAVYVCAASQARSTEPVALKNTLREMFSALCLLIPVLSWVTSSPVVQQPEVDLTPAPGATVTLHCSMAAGYSMSSYTMSWYRQARSGAPIHFLKKEYETSAETDRFSASLGGASENSFTLRVSNLTLADSATYYCAASHGVAEQRCRRARSPRGGRWGRGGRELWETETLAQSGERCGLAHRPRVSEQLTAPPNRRGGVSATPPITAACTYTRCVAVQDT